ncbi:MAG TPA: class I SAM-dependent methyltransferase [Solirubrobacteraceae bacterium]|nr:class I SAM-dependent methyltransferase [Solirubrobacteraceae bacterium]
MRSTSGSVLARRVATAAQLRLRLLRHGGDVVTCPICERGFDRFADDYDRARALCWRCGAHERHRAQWLLLRSRPELLRSAGSLLHFAPEWTLRRRLSGVDHLRYVTADLQQRDVDLQLDITALALPDASFDAVICSHVLEHIPDDASAMGELRRVTAPGGWCLVMVPLDLGRGETYEDPSLVDPEQRRRVFWRPDHVRLYSADIEARLVRAGFAVERVDPTAEFGVEACRRYGIPDTEVIWLCRPDTTPAEAGSTAVS